MEQELIGELNKLMHEIIHMNKAIIDGGIYTDLISLCEQDITILVMVNRYEHLTAKEIGLKLEIPKTTAVSAINRLGKRGYLSRMVNEEDKRERYLSLTVLGDMAVKEHETFEDSFLHLLADRWTKEDQEQLAAILKRRRR